MDDSTVASEPAASPPPDINAGLGIDDSKLRQATTTRMADTQREKVAAEDKTFADLDSAQKRILPRAEELAKTAGVEAGNMKPWNAEEEQDKHRTDPIAAFGSFGSVFGIMASAFTRNPMVNAMNASAAAMGAIKENDDKSYDRAYKAWQDNTRQALDRHKITQDAYQDSLALMQTNTQAALTKMQVNAARFGDKQVLTMLDMGMNKEVEDLLTARNKAAAELALNAPKVTVENEKMRDLLQDPRMKQPPGSIERQRAILEHQQRWAGQHKTLDEQFAERWWQENPTAKTSDFSTSFGEFKQLQRDKFSADREIVEQLREDHKNEGKPEPTAGEIADAIAKGKKGGGSQRVPKPEEAEINRRRDEKVAQGMDPSKAYTEAVQEVRRSGIVPTASLRDQLDSKIERIDYMNQTIDKTVDLLKKHKAITGLGGTVTRPGEVVSNWFGSNETDRAQFRRYISELQEWAPRALNDSSGRPLSAEAAKVQNIVAGLSPGDTTANTARAYKELKDLLGQMQGNLRTRRDGPGAAPPAAKPKSDSDAPWLRDPIVPGKRSEIDTESEAA